MADSTNTNENDSSSENEEFLGYLAEFNGPDALVAGCDDARQAGYTDMDAFSPFPVHGIDDAIGIKRTKLPVLVFCVGLFACGLGLFLQYYTNVFHHNGPFPGYDFMISGKAMFSLPANIPVTFEVIVLLSAFTAFFGMWAMNGLPKLSNPLFKHPEFRRSTSDGFFLFIEKKDSNFNEETTKRQLQEWGADVVDPISHSPEELRVPGYFKLVGLIIASLLLVPPVVIYRAHYTKNPLPRMHFNPDMDRQHRGESQDASPNLGEGTLFADKRVMRGDPVGTIARGELARHADIEFYAGIKKGSKTREQVLAALPADSPDRKKDLELEWMDDFPADIKKQLESEEAGMELYARGKRQFDVYCSVCHGYAGYGDGLVSKRGMALKTVQKSDWIAAKSLHDPAVVKQKVGRIFDTITNGRAGMGPYRSQITAADRWAIVFFVRAMQLSREGDKSDVPESERLVAWEQVDPLASLDGDSESETKETKKSSDEKSSEEKK